MHALLKVAMSVPLVTICSYCGLDYFFVVLMFYSRHQGRSPAPSLGSEVRPTGMGYFTPHLLHSLVHDFHFHFWRDSV